MSKIFICIIINNIQKIDIIKETYIKLIDDETIKYFFIADLNVKAHKEIIYLKSETNHFHIIKYFDTYDYDFMLITYEDSFVHIKNLVTLLSDNNSTATDKLYIGGHGDYRTIMNNKFWFHSYTPGIILSRAATKLLLDENLMENYNKLASDDLKNLSGVALGFYAQLFNIKTVINDNFHYCNWKGKPCHENKIKVRDIVCCYNMSKEDMYNYYKTQFISNSFTGMNLIMLPGGGLGNILFQYFAGYSLGKQYNCKVFYQINYNYWRGDINKHRMLQHLNFIDLNDINHEAFIDYNEKDFFYNPVELEEKNYKMSGYYQSYKYSEKYINEIRDELFFNVASLYFQIEKYYYSLKKDKPTCLIHVRRGDYLMYHNVHPTLSDEYYRKAIKVIPNCKYFVFSDDNNYVSNWSVLKGLDYEIVNINDPEEILIFMSLCDNFIIANSTLSLVAYLLRKNKDAKLVGPKTWFGDAGYKHKIEDIIPPNGVLINI